jgi:adenylate cyclase
MATVAYPTIDDGLGQVFDRFYGLGGELATQRRFAKSASPVQMSESYALELASDSPSHNVISRSFGKPPIGPPCIGDHPDFEHLRGTDEVAFCPITTLFMDIESSTRLSLLYPLPTVRRVKNAFIQTAIEIIRSFGGHVHRIMGDAVMAYFGGTMCTEESSIIDGINCAAVLRHFAEHVVRPKLSSEGIDHDFGVRIGLDFGPEKDVLWSSYGFPGMEEVTATSFYVDVAAKLQHAAGRNQAMFGGSLIDTIDFPSRLLSVKQVIQGGETVEEPFITPNHTYRSGQPLNYRQRQFHATDYLRLTPVGQQPTFNPGLRRVPSVPVACTIHPEKNSPLIESHYLPATRAVPKGKALRFTVRLPYMPQLPYSVKFIVENHGREAWSKNPTTGDNHEESYVVQTQSQHNNVAHWETTSFRGFHYMTVEVRVHNRLDLRTQFGVYVV